MTLEEKYARALRLLKLARKDRQVWMDVADKLDDENYRLKRENEELIELIQVEQV